MKNSIATLAAVAALTAGASAQPAFQDRQPAATPILQEEENSSAPRAGKLELRSHDVDVVINNGFATTTIVQELENSSGSALEATWAFPLPEEASLSELALWIDGSPQIGEVVEKSEADRIYEQEKQAGESTAKA